MTFPMVEQQSRVLVAHAEQCHCSIDVRIVAANNMAGWNVYDSVAFVGEDKLDDIVRESEWWPTSKKNSILDDAQGCQQLRCQAFVLGL